MSDEVEEFLERQAETFGGKDDDRSNRIDIIEARSYDGGIEHSFINKKPFSFRVLNVAKYLSGKVIDIIQGEPLGDIVEAFDGYLLHTW